MFNTDERIIAELRDLRECLAVVDPAEATTLGLALEGELSRRTPDLTQVLLRATDSTGKHGLVLGRALTAACCRTFCARLGDLHPGTMIGVWVPPWAMVQVSLGDGPKHAWGTPPNVVEMEPSTLPDLATGQLCWVGAEVKVSGFQAEWAVAAPSFTAP